MGVFLNRPYVAETVPVMVVYMCLCLPVSKCFILTIKIFSKLVKEFLFAIWLFPPPSPFFPFAILQNSHKRRQIEQLVFERGRRKNLIENLDKKESISKPLLKIVEVNKKMLSLGLICNTEL